MSPKTAFLFVPGAFCPGSYYHKVTSNLQARGHEAEYLDLPSVGRKDPAPGLQDDASHIRAHATALLDAGKDLVLVGNSYGGFAILEACKGLLNRDASTSGQVKRIVTINSPLAQKGQSMKDLVGDLAPIPEDDSEPWVEPGPVEFGQIVFFGSLGEEEGRRYAGMTRAQSVKPLLEPLSFAALKEVECTVVVSEKDLAYKKERQDEVCVSP
jgi:pimeloyl-ACP methyl ester carboxylesterase